MTTYVPTTLTDNRKAYHLKRLKMAEEIEATMIENGGILKTQVKQLTEIFSGIISDYVSDAGDGITGDRGTKFYNEVYFSSSMYMTPHTAKGVAATLDKIEKKFGTDNGAGQQLADSLRAIAKVGIGYQQRVVAAKQLIKTRAEINEAAKTPTQKKEEKELVLVSSEITKILSKEFAKLSNEIVDGISTRLRAGLEGNINRILAMPEATLPYRELTRTHRPNLSREDQNIVIRYMKTPDDFNSSLVEADWERVDKYCRETAHFIQQTYVMKQVAKLSPLSVRHEGLKSINVSLRNYSGYIESTANVQMGNGTKFTMKTNVVYAQSVNGKVFTRYPTTFHDVHDPKGNFIGKKVSENDVIKLGTKPIKAAPKQAGPSM